MTEGDKKSDSTYNKLLSRRNISKSVYSRIALVYNISYLNNTQNLH